MGGAQKSSTTQNYSPESERLLRQRTDLAGGLTPEVSRLFKGVLGGGSGAEGIIEPYMRSIAGTYAEPSARMEAYLNPTAAAAPYHAATKQALDQIMRSTPAGARQSSALGDAITKGALQRGQDMSQMRNQREREVFGVTNQREQEMLQLRNNWYQNIMQMAMQLYGAPQQPTSTTSVQKPGLSFGMGPFQGTF